MLLRLTRVSAILKIWTAMVIVIDALRRAFNMRIDAP
jgi:hypothetical protein